jgi:hypothetical protein
MHGCVCLINQGYFNDNIDRKYKVPFNRDNFKAFTASSDLSEVL